MYCRQGFRSQFSKNAFCGGRPTTGGYGGARAFSVHAQMMNLRAAQSGIYAYQMAAYTGIGAGTPGLLASMICERQAMNLCTLAALSADDLLSILKNELILDITDDDTL